MFHRKKPAGKSLEKLKAGRKELETREELRSKGLDALDVQAMQKQGESGTLLSSHQPANSSDMSEARRGLFGKKNKNTSAPVETRKIEEDYSGYSDDVANVLRQQDEDLDQIGDVLSDMRVMANAMNNELEYQDKLLHEVQDFSNETSRRAKDNARKIAKLK